MSEQTVTITVEKLKQMQKLIKECLAILRTPNMR